MVFNSTAQQCKKRFNIYSIESSIQTEKNVHLTSVWLRLSNILYACVCAIESQYNHTEKKVNTVGVCPFAVLCKIEMNLKAFVKKYEKIKFNLIRSAAVANEANRG